MYKYVLFIISLEHFFWGGVIGEAMAVLGGLGHKEGCSIIIINHIKSKVIIKRQYIEPFWISINLYAISLRINTIQRYYYELKKYDQYEIEIVKLSVVLEFIPLLIKTKKYDKNRRDLL